MKARDVLITVFATWEEAARVAAHDIHILAEDMADRIMRGNALDDDSWPDVNRLRIESDGWKRASITMRRMLKTIGGVPFDVRANEPGRSVLPWEKRNAAGDLVVPMNPVWRVRGWAEVKNVSGVKQDELDAKHDRASIKLDRDNIESMAAKHGLLEDTNEAEKEAHE